MKHIIAFLVFAAALNSIGQTPVAQSVIRTFRTIAQMDASAPSSTEIYSDALGFDSPGQPGWPKRFRYDPTNARLVATNESGIWRLILIP